MKRFCGFAGRTKRPCGFAAHEKFSQGIAKILTGDILKALSGISKTLQGIAKRIYERGAWYMNVLISGGCKNGKSFYAQRRARQMADRLGVPLYYIATMIPHDEEDHARIRRHIAEREGWGFQTIEQGRSLTELLHREGVDRNGVFLMDSVTALLDNEMFDEHGRLDENAPGRVKADVLEFAQGTGNTLFVSDYIYADADVYSPAVEDYRRSLAAVDRALAVCCDEVIEIAYGREERWK